MKSDLTAEMICDHFVGYICETKADSRHVRRVTAWIGLIVLGIDRIAVDWGYRYKRQFWFETSDGTRYRIKYGHDIGPRGGLEISKLDTGIPQSPTLEFRNIKDCEAFYNRPSLAPSLKVLAA